MVNKWLLWLVLLIAVLASSAVQAVPIGEVKKSYPDGSSVFLRGIITYITPTECYIQSKDRAAGIWAQADTTGLTLGDEVYLTGDITIENSERLVSRSYISKTGYKTALKPLAMANKSLGGAPVGLQPGIDDRRAVQVPSGNGWACDWQWLPAMGPNNIGLLVKTWGTVKSTYQSATDGTRWFYVDDGSKLISDLGDSGLLVYSDADVKAGDCVAVTGISSLEPCIDLPDKLIRVLRTRSVDDVQVTKEAQILTSPFSDEFDSPVLDPRWTYNKRCGSISVTSNPGSVRLVAPGYGSAAPGCDNIIGPELIQSVGGDWQLDVKLRADFSTNAEAFQILGIQLRNWCFDAPTRYWYGYPHYPPPPTYLAQIIKGSGGIGTFPTPEIAPGGPFQAGDAAYFRIVKTGSKIDVWSSYDGTFSGKPGFSVSMYDQIEFFGGYLVITMFNDDPGPATKPFSGYCEYFRLTSLGQ